MQRKRGLSLNHIAETLFASEMFVKKAAFQLYENKTSQSHKRSAKEKVKQKRKMSGPEKDGL